MAKKNTVSMETRVAELEKQVAELVKMLKKATRKHPEMSDEDRKAVGERLQTAKAAKMGLTLEQYRSLKLRPGQVPTAEQLAAVKGETKKPAKKRTGKKAAEQATEATETPAEPKAE